MSLCIKVVLGNLWKMTMHIRRLSSVSFHTYYIFLWIFNETLLWDTPFVGTQRKHMHSTCDVTMHFALARCTLTLPLIQRPAEGISTNFNTRVFQTLIVSRWEFVRISTLRKCPSALGLKTTIDQVRLFWKWPIFGII